MRNLFWFRHDLRLADNTGFSRACRDGEVVPCVVIDPAFYSSTSIGPNRCALFLRAVEALAASLKKAGARLIVRKGKPEFEIVKLLQDARAGGVYCNRDYDPYSVSRDARVGTALKERGAAFVAFKDLVIFERGEVLTQQGAPYVIFSQYKKTWLAQEAFPSVLSAPRKIPFPEDARALETAAIDAHAIQPESAVPEVSDRAALAQLEKFLSEAVFDYARTRDLPGIEGTSRLSPHLKFGTLSPRTVHKRCAELLAVSRKDSIRDSLQIFISELIWRDFFFQIMAEFPRVQRHAFRAQYDRIEWAQAPELLAAWKAGRTGFPIVDAGMRQLQQTGWMHNRVRMITASFLCKDLLLDWREGERHFSRLLIDGEPAVNNGNWQWAAGTGTDAQPYFRIFNPTSQGTRFDPDGAYVRRWVPELKDLPAELIHQPWEMPLVCPDYPAPLVDHAAQRLKALALYQAARK